MASTTKLNLSDSVLNILENHDFVLLSFDEYDKYCADNNHDRYFVELETFSPLGEDVICSLWFDGTDEGFIKQFREYANEFNADEHAEMWIKARDHVRGVPQSIRDLIDDADAIKEILNDLAEELGGIHQKTHRALNQEF